MNWYMKYYLSSLIAAEYIGTTCNIVCQRLSRVSSQVWCSLCPNLSRRFLQVANISKLFIEIYVKNFTSNDCSFLPSHTHTLTTFCLSVKFFILKLSMSCFIYLGEYMTLIRSVWLSSRTVWLPLRTVLSCLHPSYSTLFCLWTSTFPYYCRYASCPKNLF